MSAQVLLADDDVELSGMLREYLEREGFGVTAVHDGEAAARLALSGGYQIVVLDVMMPKVDGIEALRQIRQTRRVQWRGRDVHLTSIEFNVLEVLMRNAGRVVSKQEISENALGRPLARFDRSVDVHLSSIRQKLGDGGKLIRTVRGLGYHLVRE